MRRAGRMRAGSGSDEAAVVDAPFRPKKATQRAHATRLTATGFSTSGVGWGGGGVGGACQRQSCLCV